MCEPRVALFRGKRRPTGGERRQTGGDRYVRRWRRSAIAERDRDGAGQGRVSAERSEGSLDARWRGPTIEHRATRESKKAWALLGLNGATLSIRDRVFETHMANPNFTPDPRAIEATYAAAVMSFENGGVPIGSTLTVGHEIVSVGNNQRYQRKSNILHGEMDCIENAANRIDFRNSVLYTSLAPCLMCSGAIVLFKIPVVVILDNENIKDFSPGTDFLTSHGVTVHIAPHQPSIALNASFQTEHRSKWLPDVGFDMSDSPSPHRGARKVGATTDSLSEAERYIRILLCQEGGPRF